MNTMEADMSVVKAFTREQAARIASVSERRLSYWARHGVLVPSIAYNVSDYPHRFVYSFTDVVGLRTLGLLRDLYGLSLQQLRKVHPYLLERADQPWSSLRFWVRGDELYFDDPVSGQVVSSSREGQAAIPVEMEPVAMQVETEARALARRSRADIGHTERRRNIQGNRLLVKGTRVPVESVVSLWADGYSPERIVEAYPSLTLNDVYAVLEQASVSAVA
jgi:uncharacterized protein (DUF433 family)